MGIFTVDAESLGENRSQGLDWDSEWVIENIDTVSDTQQITFVIEQGDILVVGYEEEHVVTSDEVYDGVLLGGEDASITLEQDASILI